MNPEILGSVAGILTAVTFLPQIYKTWKSKSVKDISISTFAIIAISNILWIAYAFMFNPVPVSIVATNIMVFISSIIMIYLKLKYDKK